MVLSAGKYSKRGKSRVRQSCLVKNRVARVFLELIVKLKKNISKPKKNVIIFLHLLQEDKRWDWDRLFTEVASELQTEWDTGREEADELEES